MNDPGSAEGAYYAWVDHHNTLGLGKDVPFATGNLNGSVAFKDGKIINLIVPYPMGFIPKGLDGRIDDPNGGWKAGALGVDRPTNVHAEGGKGTLPEWCISNCARIRWQIEQGPGGSAGAFEACPLWERQANRAGFGAALAASEPRTDARISVVAIINMAEIRVADLDLTALIPKVHEGVAA